MKPTSNLEDRFYWYNFVPALLREHPQPAEMPCTFAGTFRYQRKRLAFLQEHSAASGNVLHFCGSIPLAAETSCSFTGAFRWQRMLPAEVQEHFYPTFWGKIMQTIQNKQFRSTRSIPLTSSISNLPAQKFGIISIRFSIFPYLKP